MDAIKNTAIGAKRMGVILWCVAAVVLVVFLNLHYGKAGNIQLPTYINVLAITGITALGGVDIWKDAMAMKKELQGKG